MNIKVTGAQRPSYWYAEFIGSVFEVTSDDTNNYVVEFRGNRDNYFVEKVDCQPTKAKVAEKPTHNNQMVSALWRELKRRQSNGAVPLRVDWVCVTEKRLNSALKAIMKA